ncbi:hypothetical protein SPRG_14322 [Saprolegnia parasitica CBS 223.65]|uniref:RING-type domain-containing protein n=1 Tax=Saprolegnia parasitica (strain CBS 223.65) TaxID=695850 RepID=A0A067BUC4_SAPPC|nr:hypothetical protein SPRG_14322 [Saprolegnia parasitica CBS 223.65]KDO20450.1 hypothetical protein SPRG_14322 [Saprolegnia parasitica CBS 223.65]|eukprot:XP_012208840.1 hypothetical protein SPRG_14322 [Saprolegnia parasitica CBS 223.65]
MGRTVLAVRVTKAIVSTSTKTTHYELAITDCKTQALLTTRKRHRDFKQLLQAVARALQVGHACASVCPWFYMDLQQKMPRPHFLDLFAHGRAIASRIAAFQDVLDTILMFISHPKAMACPRAADAVPKAFYDFLFADLDGADRLSSSLSSSSASSWGSSNSVTDGVICALCSRFLDDHGLYEQSACLTTLSCGHVFHDDCIVAALNVHLLCPCCVTP